MSNFEFKLTPELLKIQFFDDIQFFYEATRVYLNHVDANLEKIKTSYDHSQFDRYSKEVHYLKGSIGVFGSNEAFRLVQTVYQYCLNNNELKIKELHEAMYASVLQLNQQLRILQSKNV